jgi:hypothetical protein
METYTDEIIIIIEKILQKASLVKSDAQVLEEKILMIYPDADEDDQFENILHILASYNPNGGNYLYNEKQLRKECGLLLMQLRGQREQRSS